MTESNEALVPTDASRLNWFSPKMYALLPALLVGVYQGKDEEALAREHVSELHLLAETHGLPVIDHILFSIRTFTAATFLSQGKVEELKQAIIKLGASLVIFDDEISPAQQRNLEQELGVPVIDRTEIILGVFADRAKTKEAKLQIELAAGKYIAPRLKRMWTHFSRQTGGGGVSGSGGYLKGVGEKQIEIDRRLLKNRSEQLLQEIREVKLHRQRQRSMRERAHIPVFAIVGYTNAGKSTLMNRLTDAHVFVEDKLFATLDTTTRKLQLPDNHEVLLTDTVGFIRKLPHLLVMAFRSTLEEATFADVLIHVIDASHPMALEQAKTTLEVLSELGAHAIPVITVLNKIDQVIIKEKSQVLQKLKLTYPRAIECSATNGIGIDALCSEMLYQIQNKRVTRLLRIPQSEYHMVSEAIRHGNIRSQQYEDNDVLLEVDLPIWLQYKFEKYS